MWRGKFTALPDPQLNLTPPCLKALTIGHNIVCNVGISDGEIIAISTTDIFYLLTSFALDKEEKQKSFTKVFPLFLCVALCWLSFYKNRKTVLIKTFCFIISNIFLSQNSQTVTKLTKGKHTTTCCVVRECFYTV